MPWCTTEPNRSDAFLPAATFSKPSNCLHFLTENTAIIPWIHIVSSLPAMQLNLLGAVATSRIWFPAILLSISACPNGEQTIVHQIN